MVRSLEQSHAGVPLLASAIENGIHQATADSTVLHIGIDSNRPDPSDRTALVEEVAAYDPAVNLRNNAEESRMREQHVHGANRDFHRREVRGEIVSGGDASKRLVADSPACISIRREAGTHVDCPDGDWAICHVDDLIACWPHHCPLSDSIGGR